MLQYYRKYNGGLSTFIKKYPDYVRKDTYIMTKKHHSLLNILSGRKRKTLIFCFLAIFAVFLLCSCALFTKGDESWTPIVPIILEDAEGIKVLSENPAMVPLGEDAVFELEIDESAVIDSLPEGAVLEDGKLTLKSVFYPITLKLETHLRTLCEFSVLTEETDMGSVTSTLKDGKYWSETEVTLTATSKKGFVFAGFSIGAPLCKGGTISEVSDSYTFTLSENVRVYANFAKEWIDPATQVEVPKDKWVLLYHSNGGILSDTGKEGIKTVHFSNAYYLCPNTIPDRDHFERDGYVLYGYNTEPDGTGTYYGTGWNVVMPERGAISLYCMWAKISDAADFEYTVEADGTVTLKRYNGNDSFVVIPETIEGKPVATVSSRTFRNNDTMKKVLINKNIRALYDTAFLKCTLLEEMYFTDAVTKVGDGLLYDCKNFKKIYMLAYITPHYRRTRNGTYGIKYERLITAKGQKLIIAAGSNCAYGIDSPLLEELMQNGGQKYSVVNYGQNAGTPLAFYVEVISKHINEGDLLLLAPEVNEYQFGYNDINTTVWQIFEGAYNAFSEVDIRCYNKFFSSFATFNKARNQTRYIPGAYEYYTTDTVNLYGDYSLEKQGYTKEYEQSVQNLLNKGGVGTTSYDSCIKYISNYVQTLNRTLNMVKRGGGEVLISFAAVNKISLNNESQTAHSTLQQAYEAAIDQYISGTRISSVATYTMDTEWFYNSHNHLGTAGAKERTKLIAADILGYLSENG